MDERGRTEWEAWARLSKGLEGLGADAATDQDALLELAAFFQLAQAEDPRFSRDGLPLARFLEIAFRHAREEFCRRQLILNSAKLTR